MNNSNRITDKFLRHKLLMVTFWRVAAYKRGVNTTNWTSAYTRSVYWLTFWWNQLQLDWGYDAKTSAGRLEETAGAAPVVGTYGNSTWSDCFAPVVTLEKGKAPVCTRNKDCYLFLVLPNDPWTEAFHQHEKGNLPPLRTTGAKWVF